jgi:hypothetical protein
MAASGMPLEPVEFVAAAPDFAPTTPATWSADARGAQRSDTGARSIARPCCDTPTAAMLSSILATNGDAIEQ